MSGLQAGVAVNGSVGINQWQYYNFTATSTFFTAQLMERQTTGSVWLFVSTEQNPTLVVHEDQDLHFDKPFHHVRACFPWHAGAHKAFPCGLQVSVERNTTQARTYYVGAYGSPISTTNAGRPFTLVVWQPL